MKSGKETTRDTSLHPLPQDPEPVVLEHAKGVVGRVMGGCAIVFVMCIAKFWIR